MIVRKLLLFSACAGLVLCVCNLTTNKNTSSTTATSVSQLKITNGAISGWQMVTTADSFGVWAAADFHNDIDGGDKPYTDRGLIEVADFHLLGPNGTELGVHAYFMDFGTEAAATAMFQYQASQSIYTPHVAITGYDNTVAFGYAVLGGITAFAHFKKFYIELPFTLYSAQGQAISDANLFLGYLKAKI
jgi:hypothetical protein